MTPKYRQVHKYNIYKFICLSAMRLKYLLRTSCIVCAPTHCDIQQVHTIYKREMHKFYIKKSCRIVQANQTCAYALQGKDDNWCLFNVKIIRTQIWLSLNVCYRAFTVNSCLLFFVLFSFSEQWYICRYLEMHPRNKWWRMKEMDTKAQNW